MNEQNAYEIIKELADHGGNRYRAAMMLGCSKRTIDRHKELEWLYFLYDPEPVFDDDLNVIRAPEYEQLAQNRIDSILKGLESCSAMINQIDIIMWNIISESAEDYFREKINAQDAARVIQSKLEILMSERS